MESIIWGVLLSSTSEIMSVEMPGDRIMVCPLAFPNPSFHASGTEPPTVVARESRRRKIEAATQPPRLEYVSWLSNKLRWPDGFRDSQTESSCPTLCTSSLIPSLPVWEYLGTIHKRSILSGESIYQRDVCCTPHRLLPTVPLGLMKSRPDRHCSPQCLTTRYVCPRYKTLAFCSWVW